MLNRLGLLIIFFFASQVALAKSLRGNNYKVPDSLEEVKGVMAGERLGIDKAELSQGKKQKLQAMRIKISKWYKEAERERPGLARKIQSGKATKTEMAKDKAYELVVSYYSSLLLIFDHFLEEKEKEVDGHQLAGQIYFENKGMNRDESCAISAGGAFAWQVAEAMGADFGPRCPTGDRLEE